MTRDHVLELRAGKRRHAEEAFVGCDTKRVKVGRRRKRRFGESFWTHVPEGSDDRTLVNKGVASVRQSERDREIVYSHARVEQKNVVRLDIAVGHVGLLTVIQGTRDGPNDVHDLVKG